MARVLTFAETAVLPGNCGELAELATDPNSISRSTGRFDAVIHASSGEANRGSSSLLRIDQTIWRFGKLLDGE